MSWKIPHPDPATLAKILGDSLYKLALGSLAGSVILENKGKQWWRNCARKADYCISFLKRLITLRREQIAVSAVATSTTFGDD